MYESPLSVRIKLQELREKGKIITPNLKLVKPVTIAPPRPVHLYYGRKVSAEELIKRAWHQNYAGIHRELAYYG